MIDYANMSRAQIACLRLGHTLDQLAGLKHNRQGQVIDVLLARDLVLDAQTHAYAAGIPYSSDLDVAEADVEGDKGQDEVTAGVAAALTLRNAQQCAARAGGQATAARPAPRPKKPALPTFRAKRAELLSELGHIGWNVHDFGPRGALKEPWAEDPDRAIRLWFKPQAVWYGPAGAPVGAAHSLESDIRGLTAEALVRAADRMKHAVARRGSY